MAAMMAPWLEMIAHEDGIEAERLGETGEIQKLARSKLFCRGLVAELEQRVLLDEDGNQNSWSEMISPPERAFNASSRPRGHVAACRDFCDADRSFRREGPMKLGVALPMTDIGGEPAVVRDFAQAAEDLGYDFLAGTDHVLGVNAASRPDSCCSDS